MRTRARGRRVTFVRGVVGGLIGGLLGAGVMSAGHAVAMRLVGSQPPATEPDEDATVKVAQEISRRVRGRPLAVAEKPIAGHVVHYGFGAAMGVVYGTAASVARVVTVAAGAGFGAAAWLGAHAVVVPTLGLAPSPLRQPLAREALELVLHLAYGLTVGLVHRIAVSASR